MVTFESLGTYRLLFALQDHGALGSFADSVLGPLEAYDATHGGQLLATLGCFLDHLGKWEAAASELKVHRHTLRYRIGKAEELTGRSVHSAGDRTELWLALRARELLRLIPD